MKSLKIFVTLIIFSLNLSANDECGQDLDRLTARRNTLIRLQSLDKYPHWLYRSKTSPTHYLVVLRESAVHDNMPTERFASIYAQSNQVMEEVKELDGTVMQGKKLSYTGQSLIIDRFSGQKPNSFGIDDAIEGIVRFIPLGALIASGFIWGKEAVSNIYFYLLNGGIYIASQFIFPELSARVTSNQWQEYTETGSVSRSISRLIWGSVFDKYHQRKILKNLMARINTQIKALPSDGTPQIIAVITTPDIGGLLSMELLDSNSNFLELLQGQSYSPVFHDPTDPLHIPSK